MKHFACNSGALLLYLIYLAERGTSTQLSQKGWPADILPDLLVGEGPRPRLYSREEEPLQSGFTAKVYKGLNTITGENVAVRVIWKNPSAPKLIPRTIYEYFLQKKFRHENVLGLIDFFEDDLYFYFITELADRGDLFSIVSGLSVSGQELSEPVAKDYFTQLINGLKYLHGQKIIHRDLSIENILVYSSGVVRIADFGFSVKLNSEYNDSLIKDSFRWIKPVEGEAWAKAQVGTKMYWSPEVCFDASFSYKSDVYALGVILYAMLTSRFPPVGSDCTKAMSETSLKRGLSKVSPEAANLVIIMLMGDPRLRPTLAEIESHPWITGGVLLESERSGNLKVDETWQKTTAHYDDDSDDDSDFN